MSALRRAGYIKTRDAPSLTALLAAFALEADLTAQPAQVGRMVRLIRRFIFIERAVEPSDFDGMSVRHYLSDLNARGRSAKTIRNHRGVLSVFCRYLVDHRLLDENPCTGIRLRRPERLPPRYLTEDEIGRALAIAREHGIWPEVALALSTGLRLSEMIRLRWADVDVPGRLLTVRRSKSGRFRAVPLSRAALAALAEQRERAGEFGWVFPARQTWRNGWRYVDKMGHTSRWLRMFKSIADAVPKFHQLPGKSCGRAYHALRHTFASRLAQRGVSLYKIAEWMGHSDVRMTQRYSHLAAGFDAEIEAASCGII